MPFLGMIYPVKLVAQPVVEAGMAFEALRPCVDNETAGED